MDEVTELATQNYWVTTPQTEKIPTFPDEIAGNMSNKCTFILIKILQEHHV